MVYFHAPTRHVRGVHLGVEVADIAVRLRSVVVVVVGTAPVLLLLLLLLLTGIGDPRCTYAYLTYLTYLTHHTY